MSNILLASQLVLKHHHLLVQLAVRYTQVPGLVEDVVQEACAEFLGRAEQYDLQSDVRPLLHQIVKRIAFRQRSLYLKEKSLIFHELGNILIEAAEAKPSRESDFVDGIQALRTCLDKLSPNMRHLIEQRYEKDRTIREISREGGIKETTLRKTFGRIRDALRRCILIVQKEIET